MKKLLLLVCLCFVCGSNVTDKPTVPIQRTRVTIVGAKDHYNTFNDVDVDDDESSSTNDGREIKLTKSDMATDLYKELYGTCWSALDEYQRSVFRFCPFQNVTEKGRHHGSTTVFGYFAGWKDSKTMKFQNGDDCGVGGSPRETLVALVCPTGSDETHTRVSKVNHEFCSLQLTFVSKSICSLRDPGEEFLMDIEKVISANFFEFTFEPLMDSLLKIFL